MSLYGDLPDTKDGSSSRLPPAPCFKAPFKPPAAKRAMAPPMLAAKADFAAKAVLVRVAAAKAAAAKASLAAAAFSKPPVPTVPRMLGVPRALKTKLAPPLGVTSNKKAKMAPPPVFATLSSAPGADVVVEEVKQAEMADRPFETEIHNEYDPARPNDYEEFLMERERKRKEAEKKQRDRLAQTKRQEDEFTSRVVAPGDKKLDLNMSADDVFAKRQAMSNQQMKPPSMAKPMGPPGGKGGKSGPQTARKPPSRVIMLRNMVGRGQVDPELQGEISEECMKFGNVLKCKIHEFQEKNCPDHEAVRIFVQFSTITAASKAVKVMNGRFFGGRSVKGGHYPEEKFHKDQLTD